MIDEISDRLKTLVDNCDNVQGFVINHSVGGGTDLDEAGTTRFVPHACLINLEPGNMDVSASLMQQLISRYIR